MNPKQEHQDEGVIVFHGLSTKPSPQRDPTSHQNASLPGEGLLEDHSPKDHKDESSDVLEGRIRDAAYRAQNIIESQISSNISRRNRKQRHDMILMQKVMEEVDLIMQELTRSKPESHKANVDNLQQTNTNSSEDCGLVPLVQLLEEISHHNQYPNSLLDKGQIASLHENFKLLQEIVHKEGPAGLLKRRIRDAADRTHDIIETHISNEKHGDRSLNILAKEYQDLKKMKEEVGSILEQIMRIKMEKVSFHGANLQETNFSSSSAGASTQTPEMDSVGGASKIQAPSVRNTRVILDEDLITTIKGQMCGESSRREVISIVGMGGLGKTTLARYIFDDELIHYHFDCRAWVIASQDYHSRNTLLAIVHSLNMEKREVLNKAQEGVIREHIYKHLKGSRYIIVIDDMWEAKVWDDLKMILPDDDNGSRVIATTRLLDVAVYADSPRFIHELQFLNEDQSWNLFRQRVFCPTELENIGRLIAKNCRGLPLAIVVVAGLLSKVSKKQHDWEEFARHVSSAAIGQNDEHFSKILSLSYKHLPHHLKPCFLYLGGFPEDYDIRVSELIWLWIAEGLLKPIADKSLEEVGEEYLKDLAGRNLVLITEKKSCGKIKKCGVHDLLRDLCLQRACFERFFHRLHKEEDFDREFVGDAHRFSIHMWRHCFSHIFKEKYISHVRSILFFTEDYYHYGLNLLSTASGCKLLRVLDTRLRSGPILPEVVEKLLHLRHLALHGTGIIFSPSMFKLQNLQTLIVGGLLFLPSEIWEMSQLRHVKGDGIEFPPIPYDEIRIIDGIPLLGNLQTLETMKNFRFTRDTVEMIPNLKKLKVQYVIGESDRIWEESQLINLIHLHQLEVLSIYFVNRWGIELSLPENFAFPSTLIKLTLESCYLPWKDMRAVGSLPNLQVLKLKWNSFSGEEWTPAEGEFPKLKSLLMCGLCDLKYWRAEDIHFPCLEKLHITNCITLLEIPPRIGDISTLQCIVVENCKPAVGSSALKIQEEQQDLGNYDLRFHVIPCYWLAYEIRIIDGVLHIGNLQTLETVKNFRFTRDTVKMNLKKLKVQYTIGESDRIWEESQLNNLVHLHQLEVLSIYFVNRWGIELSLPENFAFPFTLIKLTLESCYLPWKDMGAVGSLPNLQVLKLKWNSFSGEEWTPAEGEFPKLKSLLMCGLCDLKYWQAEDIHFPCLEKLHITNCINLLEIPPRIGDISTLQCIVVENCKSAVDSSAVKFKKSKRS